MNKIKIALCDVRHRTRGLHSYQMPLGMGLIASYVEKEVGEDSCDIRIYKYAEPFLNDLTSWKPHVVGASLYIWNRFLSLFLLTKVKKYDKNILTVVGGSEIEMETSKRKKFLLANPCVDISCFGEGEITFLELIKWWSVSGNRNELENIDGLFYLQKENIMVENPQRGRIRDLDEIPSPYTTGTFDEFFNENLHPILETTRGCPFSCTFCRMSHQIYTNVSSQSEDRVASDLEYCAQRYKGRRDIQLCFADSNFGMYENNIQFAKQIRKMQDLYNWPRYIVLSTGKNKKEKIVKISNILKWGLPANMSAQSTNEETLKVIKRSNISLDIMKETLQDTKSINTNPIAELIVPLPEETVESFEKGLKDMIEINLDRIWVMTLVALNGTPIADQEMMEKYDYKMKFRVISRQFGEYAGKRIIEIEPVVVGTNTMSVEEYHYIRELSYIIQIIYGADVFRLIRNFLYENKVDIWLWLKDILEIVKSGNGKAQEQFQEFSRESMDELYDSPGDINDYFKEDHNYQKLLNGELGDNLMNKYTLLSVSNAFEPWLEIASSSALKIIQKTIISDISSREYIVNAITNIKKYIKIFYDFAPYFYNVPKPNENLTVDFDFDIDRWFRNPSLRLMDCNQPTTYNFYFTENKVHQITNYIKKSHDLSFAFQRIYRDRNYEDFCPAIERIK